MGWELRVLSPTGAFQRSFTHASTPTNPVERVEVVVDAGGKTNTLTVWEQNSGLQVEPRAVLEHSAWSNFQVTYGGRALAHEGRPVVWRDNHDPIAAGVVVTSPLLTSFGSGPADRDADALDRITAVGLEQLLRERIVKARAWQGDVDVATIARELCEEFAHPALIVDAANFPPTGFRLGLFYTPEKTVADALDDLVETLPTGGSWRVNAKREIVFERN